MRRIVLGAAAGTAHHLGARHRRNRTIRILASAHAVVTLPVLAGPANIRPAREITLTDRMSSVAGTPSPDRRIAFTPATGKQRIDPSCGMGRMPTDRQVNPDVVVMDAQRATLAMPPARYTAMQVPAGAPGMPDVPTGR